MPRHGDQLQKDARELFQNFEKKSYELNEFNFIKIDDTSDIDVNNTINIHKIVDLYEIKLLLNDIIAEYEIVETQEYMEELFNSILKQPAPMWDEFNYTDVFHLYTFEEFNNLMINSYYEIYHMDRYYVNGKPFLYLNDVLKYHDIVSYKINLYEKEVEKKKLENILTMGVLISLIYSREGNNI